MEGAPQVAPGVHGLGSGLVNWYLVETGEGVTAVDSGLPGFAKGLSAQLGRLGHRLEDVEAVVLTHSDSDHTGTAATMRDAGARVLIHGDDEPALAKPGPKKGQASPAHLVPLMWRPGFWRFMGGTTLEGGAKPTPVESPEIFSDGDRLDVPGRPRVVHTPGHTRGHCALVFEEEGLLFVGDALCTMNPITKDERPQVMPKGLNEDHEQCFRSLDALAELEADVLLPGHGEPWHGRPAKAVERARAALAA